MAGRFATWDSYLWESGGTVLRNLYGERDGAVLSRLEYGETFKQQRDIYTNTTVVGRTYDAEHLCAIHRHLFKNVYEWAGEYRTVNLTKGSPTGFAPPDRIDKYLNDAAKVIAATNWSKLGRDLFAGISAKVYAYINQAHAFRDGNGRAGKIFMEHVAEQSPWTLDYSQVAPQAWNNASLLSGPDLGAYEPVPESLVIVFHELAQPRKSPTAD